MVQQPSIVKGEKITKIYGNCVLCGERVNGGHQYMTTAEGYCHRDCLVEAEILSIQGQ